LIDRPQKAPTGSGLFVVCSSIEWDFLWRGSLLPLGHEVATLYLEQGLLRSLAGASALTTLLIARHTVGIFIVCSLAV
jgi:hypothetical protein